MRAKLSIADRECRGPPEDNVTETGCRDLTSLRRGLDAFMSFPSTCSHYKCGRTTIVLALMRRCVAKSAAAFELNGSIATNPTKENEAVGQH